MPASNPILRLTGFIFLTMLCGNLFAQKAEFSANVVQGCAPLLVNFQNHSSGSGLNYQWDFGNGNKSSLQNPGTSYTQEGTYTVKLKVWDSNGADSMIRTAYITVYKVPDADFGLAAPNSGCMPVTVSFEDQTTAGSVPITKWVWDFGDGNVSQQENPVHQYQQSGSYTVSLQVTDANGCSNSELKPNFIKLNSGFTLDFTASNPSSCAPPLNTQFTPNINGAVPGYTYDWDFGDGTKSTLQNPYKTYTTAGTYTVTLKVKDASGCEVTRVRKDLVGTNGPDARYATSLTSGCAPLTVRFEDKSIPQPVQWVYWESGPFKSNSKDTTVVFNQPGEYDVFWKVVRNGCADSLMEHRKIIVRESPQVSFHASDTLLCATPATVSFNSIGSGFTSWFWDFGNGLSSSSQHPQTIYSDTNQSYTVSLTVTNQQGCITKISKSDYIKQLITRVWASADTTEACWPLPVNFTGNMRSLFPASSWKWELGDGNTGNTKDLTHQYADTGVYYVWLTGTDTKGCSASQGMVIKRGLKPRPFFDIDTNIGCSGSLIVKFENYSQDSSDAWIDRWRWSFGLDDGALEAYKGHWDPEVKYHIPPGPKTVRLVVGSRGCYDTLEKEHLIQVLSVYGTVDNFSDQCDPYEFKGRDASIVSHTREWILSDGKKFHSDSVQYRFTTIPWSVRLIVMDTLTACRDTVDVFNPPAEYYQATPVLTVPKCAPASVNVKTLVVGDVKSVFYEFSNGFSTYDTSFTLQVTSPGRITYKVTVSSNAGCQYELVDSTSISLLGIVAEASVANDSFCIPDSLVIINTQNIPGVKSRNWLVEGYGYFPLQSDTMKIRIVKPPHVQREGLNVSLYLEDDSGCVSSKTVKAFPFLPQPLVSIQEEPLCNQTNFRFKILNHGTAGYEPVDFLWDFKDGQTSDYPEFIKQLPSEQWHYITLHSQDRFGCQRTDTFPVFGKNEGSLKVRMHATPVYSDCPPLLVNFYDSSLSTKDLIVKWEWDFGDGTTSLLRNPQKNYLLPGKYTVRLRVTDRQGCQAERVYPDLVVIKGPTGSYYFSPTEACDSLLCHFVSQTLGATKIQWDMGDGTLLTGDSVSHLFTSPGRYVPLMILSNEEGCTYSLPPQDAVNVRASPLADFEVVDACPKDTTRLRNVSLPGEGIITNTHWLVDHTLSDTGQVFKYVFPESGSYVVRLIVQNSYSCVDTLIKPIAVPGILTKAWVNDTLICLGDTNEFYADLQFFNDYLGGLYWIYGDGQEQFAPDTLVSHLYGQIGRYRPMLVVQSGKSCMDTLLLPDILVGDTLPPMAPEIHRISVNDQMQLTLEHKPSERVDFYRYHLQLKEPATGFYTAKISYDRMDTTFLHPGLDVRHSVYQLRLLEENACEMTTLESESRIHGSIELRALADTNRVDLSWNAYEGWDSLSFYLVQREDYFMPGLFHTLDTVPARQLNYTDTGILCYASPVYRVQGWKSGSTLFSQSDTCQATPPYRPDVPVLDLLRISVEEDRDLLVEWNKPLNTRFPVVEYIVEHSADGQQYRPVPPSWVHSSIQGLEYQVYLKGPFNVDERTNWFRLRCIDSCGDVGAPGPESRSIVLRTSLDSLERPRLQWSSYFGWSDQSGMPMQPNHYRVERMETDGSFTLLALVSPLDTVFTDQISETSGRKHYCYRVTACQFPEYFGTRQVFSHSNVSCAPVISRMFVPNAFTPNGDLLNDSFGVKGMYIREYHLRIYNRWGQLIFETSEFGSGWDGTWQNEECPIDVYMYVIDAVGTDGQLFNKKGNITLLR